MGHPRPLFGFIHLKAFCINDYNLHNLTINRTFPHLWGWLRFRAYPNSRRESWVGVTAVSWLFSTSRGGYHHTPTSLSTRCPADAPWSPYQSCLDLRRWRRKRKRKVFYRVGKVACQIKLLRKLRNLQVKVPTGFEPTAVREEKVKERTIGQKVKIIVQGRVPGCTGFVLVIW